ncbi:MAG: prepilin-type N-terminal cleavage/methylation domain-containing protein [Parcubacteria group bacterium]|nr:prepilin-type N-terminal cleavage/methylation domain-containing protein [Parcubacteria group bacterium]
MKKGKRGFTLVELLIVITIIVILAAIIFIAVDPPKRFSQARNARRWAEVRSILEAIVEYAADNNGSLPSGIDATVGSSQVLGTAASGCNTVCGATTTVSACLDISGSLVDTYLSSIPLDPLTGTAAITDYYVNKTASGRITVGSCDPELSQTISVSR